MAKFYDKKAHWHACKREILDKRLKKIVNDDFSDFFDYSSDFWLSLCIAYFTLSYDVIWKTKNNSIKDILKYFYDPENFKYEKNEINNKKTSNEPNPENSMLSYSYKAHINALNDIATKEAHNKYKITKDQIAHSKVQFEIGNRDIVIPINNKTVYSLPVDWLINYVDAICIPNKFFQDTKNHQPYISEDSILDTLSEVYQFYVNDMLLMNSCEALGIKELVNELLKSQNTESITEEIDKRIIQIVGEKSSIYRRIKIKIAMKEKLKSNKENVIATLLSVATINMYTINYEEIFEPKLYPHPISNRTIDTKEVLNYFGKKMKSEITNTREPGIIRNCSSHPGRIKVVKEKETYKVIFQDKDNSGNLSGKIESDLETFIEFLEHKFFHNNMMATTQTIDNTLYPDYNKQTTTIRK